MQYFLRPLARRALGPSACRSATPEKAECVTRREMPRLIEVLFKPHRGIKTKRIQRTNTILGGKNTTSRLGFNATTAWSSLQCLNILVYVCRKVPPLRNARHVRSSKNKNLTLSRHASDASREGGICALSGDLFLTGSAPQVSNRRLF